MVKCTEHNQRTESTSQKTRYQITCIWNPEWTIQK